MSIIPSTICGSRLLAVSRSKPCNSASLSPLKSDSCFEANQDFFLRLAWSSWMRNCDFLLRASVSRSRFSTSPGCTQNVSRVHTSNQKLLPVTGSVSSL